MDLADVATASATSWLLPRRALLKYASAGVSFLSLCRRSPADSPQPSYPFPVEPRARLAVTSYPFRGYFISPANRGRDNRLPGMDIKQFAGFVAENFDVHNITPLLDHFSSTEPSYLAAFRKSVEQARSHVVDLGLPGKRFYAPDSAEREAAVAFGKKCVDIAAQIGSPSVRQHVNSARGEKPDVALASGSLAQLADYGARRNIVINLENDDLVSEDPYFLVAVIEKVANPYLRALPDFGNCLTGHDAAFNHKAVKTMLMHSFNMCHVKDSVEGADGKQHTVDLAAMFKLAGSCSYRGFFSMEFENGSQDPVSGTKQLVRKTLLYLV